MNLVPVSVDSILVGLPLPCALRDQSGVLLANQGFMVSSRQDLQNMVGRRGQIYIDADQSDSFRRGYVNRLNNLVMADKSLGQIAEVQISAYDAKRPKEVEANNDLPDWLDLQTQAHAMLRDTHGETFLPRLERLQAELERHTRRNPDGTLFALIHLAGSEMRQYSATHAMLVNVICSLAARDVLKWPQAQLKALSSAVLTMNISMTELQDRLVMQKEPPTPAQLQRIQTHSPRSVDLLQQMGVSDRLWLEAVLNHGAKTPGPLVGRSIGQRLARLIQRADLFAARLSPRISRAPEPPGAAMQSCYFDENKQIDEAGAALIKAVGIYSPGTYVKLASQEIAVVIKRGLNTTTPKVAVLVNRQGMPTGEPSVRDTSLADYRIIASVPCRDVKVTHTLDKLMGLTRQAATEPW
ncbi:HD-GYP domain-containing protein [Rhodoferax antarcticus]|uniref:HD-GYP domain-containing protein n=1 Tax=Rhodoferax antarcticus TaxID=81479 RepID=UPI002223F4BC|nr:phosphohydrolase [Rhodoferax antarcticus]MCW2313822.1 HD-GYP domain-containing protein (c-di-GMP phosphodiesterase class II) [Rhodoferax antarcticus]